ncbi:MAG: hypothetical protein Kow0047_15480 [Anaerolineae bacterium]
MIAIEILQLVDQLEAVLNRGWRVPFTSSLLVNEEECLRLIDQMRLSVPDEIRQAQRIIQQRDYILLQAEEQARRILEEQAPAAMASASGSGGHDDQQALLSAQQRAASIIAEARRRSEQLQREADEYALGVLQDLYNQLETLLKQVRNGIEALNESRQASGDPAPEDEDEEVEDL